MQETVLNGQYLNRTRFENITAAECYRRYTLPFIRAGYGFAVVPTEVVCIDPYGNNPNGSLLQSDEGAGKLDNLVSGYNNSTLFACKLDNYLYASRH
jgi:hypothetical protein